MFHKFYAAGGNLDHTLLTYSSALLCVRWRIIYRISEHLITTRVMYNDGFFTIVDSRYDFFYNMSHNSIGFPASSTSDNFTLHFN